MTRLDDYVLSILSRMEVDDAQRREIEKELRSHLEEAIGRGMARGLSRERAEEEAMIAFGEPTRLARLFGRKGGLGWLCFERISFGLLLTLFCWIATDHWAAFGLWGVLIWYFLIKHGLYNRVEVNGGLLIRRLGRRPLKIPFTAITKIFF